MSRATGYTVTIKAFVESPKNDFEKQAAAAVLMATITKTKTITGRVPGTGIGRGGERQVWQPGGDHRTSQR